MVEANPGTFRELVCKISGKKLADLDTFSKSDPVCVLHKHVQNGISPALSSTEMILNDLNPEFRTPIKFRVDENNLEERLIFRMWDDDAIIGESTNRTNDDLIGEAYCTVNALIHRSQ